MDTTITMNVQLVMLVTMFTLGAIAFIAGAIILIWSAASNEQKMVLAQTSKLVQKGLAEEVAGLLGNATTFISTMNETIGTRNGVGVALLVIGGLVMGCAYWLATH